MAYRRSPIRSGLQPEKLRPGGVSIDPYSRPAAGSKLAALAGALSQLEPALQRFTAVEMQKRQKHGQEAGAAQALEAIREGAKSYKQAVRKGLIEANSNPWFRLAFDEQTGNLLAGKYREQVAARSGELEGTTDLNAYHQLSDEVRQDILDGLKEGETSQAMLAAFDQRAAQIDEQLGSAFASKVSANKVDAIFEGHSQRVDGILSEGGPDVVAQIQRETDRLYQTGIDPTRLNDNTVEAIIGYAVREHDLKALEVAEQLKGGSGPIAAGKRGAALAQAHRAITSDMQSEDERRLRTERIEKDQFIKDQYIELGNVVSKSDDPLSVDFSPITQKVSQKYGALEAGKFQETADAYIQGLDDPGNRMVFQRALDQAWNLNTSDPFDIDDARWLLRSHQVSTGQFNSLVGAIQNRDNELRSRAGGSASGKSALSDSIYNDVTGRIGDALGKNALTGLFDKQKDANLVRTVEGRVEMRWLQWYHDPANQNNLSNETLKATVLRRFVAEEYLDGLAQQVRTITPSGVKPALNDFQISDNDLRKLVEMTNTGELDPDLLVFMEANGVDITNDADIESFIKHQIALKAVLRASQEQAASGSDNS